MKAIPFTHEIFDKLYADNEEMREKMHNLVSEVDAIRKAMLSDNPNESLAPIYVALEQNDIVPDHGAAYLYKGEANGVEDEGMLVGLKLLQEYPEALPFVIAHEDAHDLRDHSKRSKAFTLDRESEQEADHLAAKHVSPEQLAAGIKFLKDLKESAYYAGFANDDNASRSEQSPAVRICQLQDPEFIAQPVGTPNLKSKCGQSQARVD